MWQAVAEHYVVRTGRRATEQSLAVTGKGVGAHPECAVCCSAQRLTCGGLCSPEGSQPPEIPPHCAQPGVWVAGSTR